MWLRADDVLADINQADFCFMFDGNLPMQHLSRQLCKKLCELPTRKMPFGFLS